MQTGLLIPIEVRSMSFSFLLEERILEASLRFETFTITRFGPFLLLIQWQSSTLEGSTLTSKCLNGEYRNGFLLI